MENKFNDLTLDEPIDTIELIDWETMKFEVEIYRDKGVTFSICENDGSNLEIVDFNERDGRKIYEFLKRYYG